MKSLDIFYLSEMVKDLIKAEKTARETIDVRVGSESSLSRDALVAIRSLYVALKRYKDPLSNIDLFRAAQDMYLEDGDEGKCAKVLSRIIFWELRFALLNQKIITPDSDLILTLLNDYFPHARRY